MIRLMTSLALAVLMSAGGRGANLSGSLCRVDRAVLAGWAPPDVTGQIVPPTSSRAISASSLSSTISAVLAAPPARCAPRAGPDGYTLVVGHMGTHAAAPALYPNLGYNPEKDAEPVVRRRTAAGDCSPSARISGRQPQGFLCAKANVGKIYMGHAGVTARRRTSAACCSTPRSGSGRSWCHSPA